MVTLLLLVIFAIMLTWLHYQQLCSSGGSTDPYISDLNLHLQFAQEGMIYSTASLLIGPAYALGGRWGIAVLLAAFHLAAVGVFAWGLRPAVPQLPCSIRLVVSLAVYLAQAVWVPCGGYWYNGTIIGVVYHNTTYIMLAPFALLAVLLFYRVWHSLSSCLDLRTWSVYTALLTIATSFKASLVFAFAPALLVLLIIDLFRTRGKNLRWEFVLGCSVLPSIALCVIQAGVLFSGEESGIRLIFTVPFEWRLMKWGVFNKDNILGLLRSFVFVVSVGVLLRRYTWRTFRYRFSLLLFAVSMAEALLLVESGDRLYHGNLWWGAFICFWVFLLESVSVWLQAYRDYHIRKSDSDLGFRVTVCGAMLAWHIVSGVYYLLLLMQGWPYGFPI